MTVPNVAEIFNVTVAETGLVVIEKGTDVAPPGTMTVEGTVAAGPLDESVTRIPLGGA